MHSFRSIGSVYSAAKAAAGFADQYGLSARRQTVTRVWTNWCSKSESNPASIASIYGLLKHRTLGRVTGRFLVSNTQTVLLFSLPPVEMKPREARLPFRLFKVATFLKTFPARQMVWLMPR